jgi:signal peptidase II
MKKRLFLVPLAVIVVDQMIKLAIRYTIPVGSSIGLLPVLRITHIENTGAGWSLLPDQNVAIAFISVAIIGALLYWFDSFKKYEQPWVALIIGGAAGNLIDRILLGHVIDFVDTGLWPVFNFADASISVGIVALLYLSFKH